MFQTIKHHIGEIQIIFVLIMGMILQYLMGTGKGAKAFFTILFSTLFMSVLIGNGIALLDGKTFLGITFHITLTSPLMIIGVGLSSLLSMELVAMVIKFAPKAISDKLKKGLEIDDEESD